MFFLEGSDLPSALLSQHVLFWSICDSVAASQPSVSPNPRWSAALMKSLEHRHFHSNTIKPRPPKHTPVPWLAAAPKGVEPITCFWRMFTNRRIAEAALTKEFNHGERSPTGTSALVFSDSQDTTMQIFTRIRLLSIRHLIYCAVILLYLNLFCFLLMISC